MIGALTWEITAAGVTLAASSGSLNIDEMNVPAITASVLVPYNVDIDALDPRQTPPPRATLRGTFTQWASQPISAITDYLAANNVDTLADLSSLWSGYLISNVTALFGTPLDVGAETAAVTMEIDLHIREISASKFDMVISLADDEALLTDWAPTDGLDFAALGDYAEGLPVQRARTYIDPVLQLVLGIRTDVNAYTNTDLSTTYTDVINRELDMSAWEMIRQPLDDAGLKMRVNRDGRGFSLQDPVNEIPGKEWDPVFTDLDVIDARRVFSRNGDWYDSASLLSWTTSGTRIYRGGPTGVHSRTYRERFAEGTPLTSAKLVNMNKRNANRGQYIDLTAPIRLGVFMMDEFEYQPEGEATQEWRVQGVTYDFLAGTMSIRGVQRY